jgi:hypothetical protein
MSSTHPTRSATKATSRATVLMMDRASRYAIPRRIRMAVCLVSSAVLSSVLEFESQSGAVNLGTGKGLDLRPSPWAKHAGMSDLR